MELKLYRICNSSLDDHLPRLVEKLYLADRKVLVLCSGSENVSILDKKLWTFCPDSFVPHGTIDTVDAGFHPVFLTSSLIDKSGYDVLFVALRVGESLSDILVDTDVSVFDILVVMLESDSLPLSNSDVNYQFIVDLRSQTKCDFMQYCFDGTKWIK